MVIKGSKFIADRSNYIRNYVSYRIFSLFPLVINGSKFITDNSNYVRNYIKS